jgi:branched-chain amino acid transport system permease protein
MTLEYVLSQLLNGFRLGNVYAIVAIGYSIVYGILRLINFAHGDILAVGAYTALTLMVAFGAPIWLTIPAAVGISIALGLLVERAAYRPLRSANEETTLVSSLAVSTFLQTLLMMVFSEQRKAFHLPAWFTQIHTAGILRLSNMNIIIFISTFLILIVLGLTIRYTRIGMAMRACSDNQRAAALMGINMNKVVMFAFAVGSGLAALAGIMLAGEYKTIDPLMGFAPGLKAFVAAVIGGIGKLSGAVLGAFILGFAEMLFAGLLPTSITPYRDAFVFTLLILILLVRPYGLLGESDMRRS